MVWWKFRKESKWAGVDFSTLIPERLVESEKDPDSGRVILLQPRFTAGLPGRWLQPRLAADKKFIRIKLEKRGSVLWEKIDGLRDVADLAAELLEIMPEEKEEILDRVSAYVYQLECNKLVRFRNLDS